MTNGHRYNIDSLLTFAVGGSPMRPELQKTITENLLRGRIPVKQVYGSSEQGVVANWTTKSDINTVVYGCVGKPAAGIEIRVSEKKKKRRKRNAFKSALNWNEKEKKRKTRRCPLRFLSICRSSATLNVCRPSGLLYKIDSSTIPRRTIINSSTAIISFCLFVFLHRIIDCRLRNRRMREQSKYRRRNPY